MFCCQYCVLAFYFELFPLFCAKETTKLPFIKLSLKEQKHTAHKKTTLTIILFHVKLILWKNACFKRTFDLIYNYLPNQKFETYIAHRKISARHG